jgi:hypothetical protein
MGRRPIGRKAMTPTEYQRRWRAKRLAKEAAMPAEGETGIAPRTEGWPQPSVERRSIEQSARRRLIVRLLQLKTALDAGADPLWVDYGCVVAATRYFHSILPGLELPSVTLVRALRDKLDGAHSAYLDRPHSHRPTLERRLDLMGGIAFMMEMLITTKPIIFQEEEAAQLISDKLKKAGILPFGGRTRRVEWEFTREMVVKWHNHVVSQATALAPERQMFEALVKDPARSPPEQEKWAQQRRENERKAWVDRFIAGMSREYFSTKH